MEIFLAIKHVSCVCDGMHEPINTCAVFCSSLLNGVMHYNVAKYLEFMAPVPYATINENFNTTFLDLVIVLKLSPSSLLLF